MGTVLRYQSPDGDILIETDEVVVLAPDGFKPKGGLVNIDGGVADKIIDAGTFEAAIARVKVLGDAVAKAMYEIATTPETAEVELALKFTGAAGVVFAKVGAEAQMRVKLIWKPKPKTAKT
jgi:hypothetical protein